MKSFILLFQLSLLITWSECLKFHVPIGRRTFMQSTLASSGVATVANAATTLPEEFRQGTLGAGNSDEGPVPKENYKKMSSGIVYADLKKGRSSDKVVEEGSRVNIQWLLRKANGYFVDSSEVSGGVPFIFTVGDGSAIPCVDSGVRGMSQGSSRRLICPIPTTYVKGLKDGAPGPLPVGYGPKRQVERVMTVRKDPGEYIFFEIQVTRVS
jgi:FKBP-type peptidyl-prolyl cis-trans isomerase